MAGLEVQIGADAAEFEAAIAQVEAKIKNLEKQKRIRIGIDADTGDLDKKILAANANLDKLKNGLNNAAPAINNFNKKIGNGSNALTQFGRIAQDAPFGIMGIGNNITATAESFGYLVKETGSAGAAFKAVGASLMGTGGLLLAISLVTSGLTYMSQKGITVSDVFNKLSGTFDQARKDMQDLNVESAKNAQAQISSVGAYVSAAKNINLSMEDRLIAVKKLQDEYPAYFGNLTKEEILNGNVAKTVRDVTSALIAKAKAAALTDRIVKLAEEEEKIQNSVNNSIAAQFKQYRLTKQEAYDAAVILNKQLRGEIDLEAELTAGRANALSKAEKTALAAFKYSQTLQGLGGELRKNIQDQDKLTNSLEKQTAAQIKLDYTKEKASKKTYDTPQVSGVGNVTPDNSLVDLNTIETFNGKLDEFKNKLRSLPGEITTSFKGIRPVVSSELLATLKLLQDFNKDLDSLVKTSITKTFEELGTSIGEALAKGQNVFGAIGKTLISSIGAFLSEMGSLLIKYGTLAVAKGVIDKALTSGNPVVTIGAGVAAIAVGVALKAAGGAISSKASGSGASSGNYSSGASYSSPASRSNSSVSGGSSFGSGTVVFEISGQSLIGVLKNTLDSNKRLGGSLTL